MAGAWGAAQDNGTVNKTCCSPKQGSLAEKGASQEQQAENRRGIWHHQHTSYLPSAELLEPLFTLLPAPGGNALQLDPEEKHISWLVFPELA